MSRFRTVSRRPRLAVLLAAVMAVVTLGPSLAQAEDLTASVVPLRPEAATVPPIVSPRSDQAPEMPLGGPGAVPGAGTAGTVGPPPLVVTTPPAVPTVAARGQGVDIHPRVPRFVEGQSVEEAAKRTANSKTFRNP